MDIECINDYVCVLFDVDAECFEVVIMDCFDPLYRRLPMTIWRRKERECSLSVWTNLKLQVLQRYT